MLSPGNTLTTALLRVPDAPPGAARALEPGQVVDAVARSATRNGQLSLQLAGQLLQARTDQAIQAGDRLRVEVLRQNSDGLMLRVLPPQRTSESTEAMRALLGRQGGGAGLYANAALSATRPDALRALPEPVQQAVRSLWQALPDAAQVARAEGLRQAVADSGLQLERRLHGIASGSEGPGVLRNDGKAQLAGLLNRVFQALEARPPAGAARDPALPPGSPQARAAPPPPQAATLTSLGSTADALGELARQGDGALARTQLTQLALATGDPLALFFELPVRDGPEVDLLQFRLEREASTGGGEGDVTWRVRLSFNFERLGPMHAVIHLAGDAVAATWWTEQAATRRFLERHMDTLGEQLEGLGLRVAGLTCTQGEPPPPEGAPGAPQGGWLHERA